jgi:hypothetical protein
LLLKLQKLQTNHRSHFNQSQLNHVEPIVMLETLMSSLVPDLCTRVKINYAPNVFLAKEEHGHS